MERLKDTAVRTQEKNGIRAGGEKEKYHAPKLLRIGRLAEVTRADVSVIVG